MVPLLSVPTTLVPYTCAWRIESAMLYASVRIKVALLNFCCCSRRVEVMMSMMLTTTKSSTRVNPFDKLRASPFLLPEERERDKEVDVESIDNESSEHQKRREGDLAFNFKPLCQSARRCCGGKLGKQYEQHAPKRSAPKSNHKCRGAIGEPQEPPKGKLERRVPPPHPGASGYEREKKKWQCKQWAGKQSPQDGVSGGPKSWTYEVQLSADGKCKVEDCK